MADLSSIEDIANLRAIAAAVAANPGAIAIENVAGTLKQVDDQGVATSLGGAGGTGTVTSVAATAGGLLAVAGTPTVAPTVGLAAAAAGTIIGNVTGGSAVPTALTGRQTLSVVMTGTSTRVDVVSAVQNIDFSSLSGDTDGDYEIEFYIVDAASGNLTFQPQQDATNGVSRGYYTNGVTMTQASGGATLFFNAWGAINAHGTAYFRSKSGQGNRYWRCISQDETPTNPYNFFQSGYWADTTTVLTNVRIHHSNATGIGIGSWFVLRKMGKL